MASSAIAATSSGSVSLPTKRILVLTPQFPFPPHQGTTIRNFNLILGLARHHEVHLLSFGDSQAVQSSPLHDCCQSIQVVSTPKRTMRQRLDTLLFTSLPDMARRLPSPEFRSTLDAAIERLDPDIIEIEGIELAPYLFQAAARKDRARYLLVFDDHNAEYILQQRAFETELRAGRPRRWLGAVYSFIQWQRLRRYERRACLVADRVIAVSEADARALRRLSCDIEPAVVPNGVDLEYYGAPIPTNPKFPGTGDLVFTGKMDFRPNVDAVLWFVQRVLPLIRGHVPEARFWVVGKDPHPRIDPIREEPGVIVTGRVDDVRPYIGGAAVYVIPLRIGGGTRLKVLEAMAMGRAIVSTTMGCEGFDLTSGRELVMADDASSFAEQVVALLRDPHARQRLGHVAEAFAAERYDWRTIVPQLERVYH